MTATPPPSSAENPQGAPGPDVEAVSYGQYGASSGRSADVPPAPTDPAPYGQPTPARGSDQPGTGYGSLPTTSTASYGGGPATPTLGYSAPQPTPGYAPYPASAASYGTPAQGPFTESHPSVDPYGPPRGYPEPARYAPSPGYVDPNPYAPVQGFGEAPQYAPTHAFGEPTQFAPGQTYGDPTYGQGYAQPGGYPTYGLAPMVMAPPLPTGMAVAAMVCGIVGLVLSLCGGWTIALSIVGIVLGAMSVRKANRGQAGGRGMALAGIITGAIGVAISSIVIVVFIIAAIAS